MTELVEDTSGDIWKYSFFSNKILICDNGYDDDGAVCFDNVYNHKELYKLRVSEFPRIMHFTTIDDYYYKDLNVAIDILSVSDDIKFQLSMYFGKVLAKIKWHPRKYLDSVKEEIENNQIFTFVEELDEDISDVDFSRISFDYKIPFKHTIEEHLQILYRELFFILSNVNSKLNGFSWRSEYDSKENIFTIEVVLPLLRKMNFLDVVYNHGTQEFGKDIIFSKVDDFGNINHFGVQVKAGNISGKVNSEIDEILGQIKDAFQLPFIKANSTAENYISGFYIILSGHLSENAKTKIRNKIPKELIGVVHFFDRNKILELVEKFWT